MSVFWCSLACEDGPIGVCLLEEESLQDATAKFERMFPWVSAGFAQFDLAVSELNEEGSEDMRQKGAVLDVLYPPCRVQELGGKSWDELSKEDQNRIQMLTTPEKFN